MGLNEIIMMAIYIAVFAGLGVKGYQLFYVQKKTVEDLLTTHSDTTFATLATLSTLLEVLSLTDMAVSNGRLTVGSALSRYMLVGVIEIVSSFFFFYTIKLGVRHALKPDKAGIINITARETIVIYIKATPLFIFGLLVTTTIFAMYLDTINVIEIQQQGLLPYFNSVIVTNFDEFSEAAQALPQGKVDSGSIIVIYTTPLINLVLGYKTIEYAKREGVLKLATPAAPPTTPAATPAATPSTTPAGKPAAPATPAPSAPSTPTAAAIDVKDGFNKFFGISGADLDKAIGEFCGVNLATNAANITPKAHVDLQAGTMTSMDVFKLVETKLLKPMKEVVTTVDVAEKASKEVQVAINEVKSMANNVTSGISVASSKNSGKAALGKANTAYSKIRPADSKCNALLSGIESELLFVGLSGKLNKPDLLSQIKSEFATANLSQYNTVFN